MEKQWEPAQPPSFLGRRPRGRTGLGAGGGGGHAQVYEACLTSERYRALTEWRGCHGCRVRILRS